MLYTVLIVIGILLAAILIVAATKPGTFRVERAKSIQAPPERIFDLINDFHRWGLWSPWEKLDPMMKRTFAGAEQRQGRRLRVGGQQQGRPGAHGNHRQCPGFEEITIKLDFLKPFEAHNTAEFTLEPAGQRHQCHLGDVRSPSLHGESDVGICQYGPPDRKRF